MKTLVPCILCGREPEDDANYYRISAMRFSQESYELALFASVATRSLKRSP
jgi:hypothetical protein